MESMPTQAVTWICYNVPLVMRFDLYVIQWNLHLKTLWIKDTIESTSLQRTLLEVPKMVYHMVVIHFSPLKSRQPLYSGQISWSQRVPYTEVSFWLASINSWCVRSSCFQTLCTCSKWFLSTRWSCRPVLGNVGCRCVLQSARMAHQTHNNTCSCKHVHLFTRIHNRIEFVCW